ncbi:unnamed protein product [Parnassius mnemosyne]|uniref:Integrase catalytic domain-containing protein n=1 Tax=Parnassius mnemosyne TaxID=213953 RepID=A0AAV1LNT3_9NEOP
MRKTRSQKTRNDDDTPVGMRIFEEAPASPSDYLAMAQAPSAAPALQAPPAPASTPAPAPPPPRPAMSVSTTDRLGEVSISAPRTETLAAIIEDLPSTEISSIVRTVAPVTDVHRPAPRAPSVRSVRSARSTASAIAKLKQIEYNAAEELAAIRRKQLQLEEDLIRKKYARDVAQLQEETDRESVNEDELVENRVRVDRWLENVETVRGESPSRPSQPAPRIELEQTLPNRVTGYDHSEDAQGRTEANNVQPRRIDSVQREDGVAAGMNQVDRRVRVTSPSRVQRRTLSPTHRSPHRHADRRSPSPHRDVGAHRTPAPQRRLERDRDRDRSLTPRGKDRGIERLAEALENMVRVRPAAAKQTQDLPIFNGSAAEWLAFKAAMKESTRLYGFTDTENMARLRNCLRGEAREVVSALLFTAKDPADIMRTLEQCFGRPEVIIDRALEELKRLPRPGQTAQELNAFAIKLQNIVCILQNVDGKGYLQNPMLTREVTSKLSPHLRSRWCDYAEHYGSADEPDIVTLSRFMMREADRALSHAYTSVEPTKESPVRREAPPSKRIVTRRVENRARDVKTFTAQEDTGSASCMCCGGEHAIAKCRKLAQMGVDDRWNWVKEDGVCFLCLNSKHRRFKCKAKKCGIDGCNAPHHALLHTRKTRAPETSAKPDETVLVASNVGRNAAVLLKVCPITLRGPHGKEIDTYALLDEGSTISLIDDDLARELGAEGPVKPLNIRGISNSQREADSRLVNIGIRGKSRSEMYRINARTVTNLQIGSQSVNKECLRLKHLRDLPSSVCYEDAKPRLLLGADNWHLIITRNLRIGRRRQPIAARTLLGWVIQGTVPRFTCREDGETVLHVVSSSGRIDRDIRTFASQDEEITELLKRQYEIDSIGISLRNRPRREEERAVEIFQRTVKKVGDQYQVGLPWKDDDVRMPPSYEMAARRLRTIERKMDKSPEFRDAYTAQIDNLLAKGYAREAEGTEREDPRSWYLPHFAVRNPNKPGKTRVVFDAAARASGKCLNDYLLDGPDLLRNLPGILFRFRENEIAVSADIREMFLRVKIDRRDQPAQLFLWRGNERSSPPREYVMTSMIFGARSSPFLAHSVRDHNARAHAETHPLALNAIVRSHYMDDYLDSYATVEEAVNTARQVTEVHQQAGFTLAGWNSNHAALLEDKPEELLASKPKEVGLRQDSPGRTLGLLWMANEDALTFNTSMNRVPNEVKTLQRPPTKREALSAVMSVFDPLGLLSYLTITAKILLQDLWRMKKVGWDDELPEEASEEFQRWLRVVEEVSRLRLPRCYAPTGGVVERQLHVFSDASERAYASAAYWRLRYRDGTVKVRLVAAKAKVAPIKAQSIPRLELQANLIGARLAEFVQGEHRVVADRVVYWTDSTTALHWIQNDTARYTPYVAHRLGEISEKTSPEQWRWIPTADNIADQATRISYTYKEESDKWFTGPPFLYEEEDRWPRRREEKAGDEDDEMEEVVAHQSDTRSAPHLPDIERFSSYERLVRATARILQFVDAMRGKAHGLTLDHIQKAERMWIERSQQESFAEDISRLQKGRNLATGSALRKLDPIFEDGVLRARGRIDAANVDSQMKRPIILNGRHQFVKLLVEKAHKEASHANRERVVNDLRTRYHILRLRPTVREVERRCLRCRVRKATPRPAVIGDLPPERLGAFARPFTYTGIDYFGPITVTIGRRHEKRWIALFTCLTTRAVHLEIVYSLTTDSAISALRRMAARRGWPRVIYSDNGTNFHGADTELRRAMEEWAPLLKDYALTRRTDWKFIAPGAPNQGGAWERLVRSVKTALEATLNQKSPREETLATLLTEAENTVNSRPLTHVPVDIDEEEALTPNHFLLLGPSSLPVTAPCTPNDRRAWRAAQGLADEYWKRWVKEYLPTLVARGDSRDVQQRPVQEGDLVVVADGTMPRNVWPRGVVTRTFPGPDGVVRNVEVKTRGGLLRRPVRRIAVLPSAA